MPEGCVLLDYFSPKYRYGITPDKSVFDNTELVSCSEFGFTRGIVGNKVPIGVFSNSILNLSTYNCSVVSNTWTLEFYLSIQNPVDTFYNVFNMYESNNANNHFLLIFYGMYTARFSYNTKTNNWYWDNVLTRNANLTNWNHFLITKNGNVCRAFINGELLFTTNNAGINWNSLEIANAAYDVNNGVYVSGYKMSQLALWNRELYTESFTPRTEPIKL